MIRPLFLPSLVLGFLTASASGTIIYSGPQNIVLQGVPTTFQDITLNLAGDPGTGDNLELGIAELGVGFGQNGVGATSEVALASTLGTFPLITRFGIGDLYPSNPVFGSGGILLWSGVSPLDGDFFAALRFGTFGSGPAYSGWIHLMVQNSATSAASIKVVDWAYSDVVGETIRMGQTVPEPSTFSMLMSSLLAASLFGMAHRTTRRQVRGYAQSDGCRRASQS